MRVPAIKKREDRFLVSGNSLESAKIPTRYGDQLAEQRQREDMIMKRIRHDKQTSSPSWVNYATAHDPLNQSQFRRNNAQLGPLAVFAEELHTREDFEHFENRNHHQSVGLHEGAASKDWIINISRTGADISAGAGACTTNKGRELRSSRRRRNNPAPPSYKRRGRLPMLERDSPSDDSSNKCGLTNAGRQQDGSLRIPYLEPILQDEFKLPRLKSELGPGNLAGLHESPALDYGARNTEFPRLPAQEYIDSFRKDAMDFERSLQGINRGSRTNSSGRRATKGNKTRENLLPKIDEKIAITNLSYGATQNSKFLNRDEQFRLPKLQHRYKDFGDVVTNETASKRKKTKNSDSQKTRLSGYNNQDSIHASSIAASQRRSKANERKTALQKEQEKWCKMTFQSNAYM